MEQNFKKEVFKLEYGQKPSSSWKWPKKSFTFSIRHLIGQYYLELIWPVVFSLGYSFYPRFLVQNLSLSFFDLQKNWQPLLGLFFWFVAGFLPPLQGMRFPVNTSIYTINTYTKFDHSTSDCWQIWTILECWVDQE